MPKYKSLADYFKDTRRSQESLAESVGVTPAYISMITSGLRQPALDVAVRISDETGVPVSALVLEERSA